MPIFSSSSLKLTDTIEDGSPLSSETPLDAVAAQINGTTYLFVPNFNSSSMQVFRVDPGGVLTEVGVIQDTPATPLSGAWAVDTYEVDGQPYLVVANNGDTGSFPDIGDGLVVFALGPGPNFLTLHQEIPPGPNNLVRTSNVKVMEAGGNTFVLASGFDDGFSVHQVQPDGTLVQRDNQTLNTSPFGAGYEISDPVSFAGQTYVAVTASSRFSDDLELFVFTIDPNTGLATQLTAENAVGEEFFRSVALAHTGNELVAFVIVSEDGVQEGRLMTVSDRGLSTVQTVSLPGFYSKVQAMNLDGQVHFVATGDEIGVFTLDVLNLQLDLTMRLRDGTGQGTIGHAGGLVSETFDVDGKTYLAAPSAAFDAVNIYEIGALDDVIQGTLLADEMYGKAGDDILYGLGGNDLLDGGSGTDILYAGSGDDDIMVSLGEDQIFGGSGDDTVDLRGLDPSGAVTIDFLRQQIVLPGGETQFVTDVEGAYASNFDDTLVGDAADNLLFGRDGDDLIRGREGDDNLVGNDGADQLFGASGNDLLRGSAGADLINGGEGDDRMEGGRGDDRLFAGAGNDTVKGDQDDDLIKGNGGDDDLDGGDGNDTVIGQSGDDILNGGAGDDLLQGGSGRDVLIGGGGTDTMTGGSAADTFVFLTGANGGVGTYGITDFKTGTDRIDLSDFAFTNFSLNSLLISQAGDDVEIRILSGSSLSDFVVIRIEDVDRADLALSDFIL